MHAPGVKTRDFVPGPKPAWGLTWDGANSRQPLLIQMLSDTTRFEQALQAVANRAARTASLCCYRVDGADGAVAVVRARLESVTTTGARNRIFYNNDMAADARVVFIDVAGDEVTSGAVPPGGTAYVFLTCRIPPGDRRLRHPRPRCRASAGGRGHRRPVPFPLRRLTPAGRPRPSLIARWDAVAASLERQDVTRSPGSFSTGDSL